MPDGVLPSFLLLLEVRKPGGDVRVNFAQRCPFLGTILDRHRDQSDVTKRWFFVSSIVAVGTVGSGTGLRSGPIRGRRRRRRRRRSGRVTVSGAMEYSRR